MRTSGFFTPPVRLYPVPPAGQRRIISIPGAESPADVEAVSFQEAWPTWETAVVRARALRLENARRRVYVIAGENGHAIITSEPRRTSARGR